MPTARLGPSKCVPSSRIKINVTLKILKVKNLHRFCTISKQNVKSKINVLSTQNREGKTRDKPTIMIVIYRNEVRSANTVMCVLSSKGQFLKAIFTLSKKL
jgi:hypothetical protein